MTPNDLTPGIHAGWYLMVFSSVWAAPSDLLLVNMAQVITFKLEYKRL